MDLTWTFYQRGYSVRFIPEALCYPLEPHDYAFLRKQLRRWSHGFVQNVHLHWRFALLCEFRFKMLPIPHPVRIDVILNSVHSRRTLGEYNDKDKG